MARFSELDLRLGKPEKHTLPPRTRQIPRHECVHVPCRSSGETLGRDNHLTDWPEREPSKLQMRPGEGDADNGYGEQDSSDYATVSSTTATWLRKVRTVYLFAIL